MRTLRDPDMSQSQENQRQDIIPYGPIRGSVSRGDEIAVTRVMSPNLESNEGTLSNLRAFCQECDGEAFEPAMCSRCGIYGHPECLGLEMFFAYPFCRVCAPQVISEYATF